MRYPYSLAAVRSVAVSTLTNQFVRRLLLSIMITGFDGSVLITAGQAVLTVASEAPWMTAAFSTLSLLMLATLARIWFLTLTEPSPQPTDHPRPKR
jgi:hypothetical protein